MALVMENDVSSEVLRVVSELTGAVYSSVVVVVT